jgi:hypothetical protein
MESEQKDTSQDLFLKWSIATAFRTIPDSGLDELEPGTLKALLYQYWQVAYTHPDSGVDEMALKTLLSQCWQLAYFHLEESEQNQNPSKLLKNLCHGMFLLLARRGYLLKYIKNPEAWLRSSHDDSKDLQDLKALTGAVLGPHRAKRSPYSRDTLVT